MNHQGLNIATYGQAYWGRFLKGGITLFQG